MHRIYTVVLLVICSVAVAGAGQRHRLGVGAHYLTVVDDVDIDNIESDTIAGVVTYQYRPVTLLGIEADLEIIPKDFLGSSDPIYGPQAYLILGSAIYGALGMGINYFDGDLADDPFYALRVGLDLELLPNIHLDINANYRVTEWNDIDAEGHSIDSDTITVGGALRVGF